MNTSLKLGGAFIGLMVGAGFASGQEILQFFTSFGWYGLLGALVATLAIAFLVMNLLQIGSRLQSQSHEAAIEHICGRHLGKVVDVVLTFFLFGSIVVMLAGAGSSFQQQFGLPGFVGALLLALLTVGTVCLGIKRVIDMMSVMTPVLMIIVAIVTVYALVGMDKPFSVLEPIARSQPQAAGHWLLSALLYVSYNIAATAAVLVVIGGSVRSKGEAGWGGILGGLGIGLLILALNCALLARVDEVGSSAIPTLLLSNEIAPWFGHLMLVVILAELYCTTVGLTYALAARCKSYGLPFNLSVMVGVAVAFAASLLGFVSLVGLVYPVMGYLGFVLMAAIVVAWVRNRRQQPAAQPA